MARHTKTTRTAAAAALALLAAGMLAACGSSGPDLDGTYFGHDGRVTIDGTDLSYHSLTCSDTEVGVANFDDEPDAVGQLTEDGTEVLWATDDEHIDGDSIGGTMTVTISDSSELLHLEDYQFTAGAEDTVVADYAEGCTAPSDTAPEPAATFGLAEGEYYVSAQQGPGRLVIEGTRATLFRECEVEDADSTGTIVMNGSVEDGEVAAEIEWTDGTFAGRDDDITVRQTSETAAVFVSAEFGPFGEPGGRFQEHYEDMCG